MATSYQATLNLVVSGARQIKDLEKEINGLDKKIDNINKKANVDVGKREEIREVVRARKEALSVTEAQVAEDRKKLLQQVKLNAAVRLYQRRLEDAQQDRIGRKEDRKALSELQYIFEQFNKTGDIEGIRAISEEVGRIAENNKLVRRSELSRFQVSKKIASAQQQIADAQRQGLDVSKAQAALEKASVNNSTNRARGNKIELEQLKDQLDILREQTQELERQRKASVQKSISRKREKVERARRLQQDLQLGIGFPLLFGGGPGAVAGGALGALAGGGKGGFGSQILFSAIGQQLDTVFQAATERTLELADALTEFKDLAGSVADSNVLSSRATEKQIEVLKKAGFEFEANRMAYEDLLNTYGPKAINDLENLGKEFQQMQRELVQLGIAVGAFVAGPLANFIKTLQGTLTQDARALSTAEERSRFVGTLQEGKRGEANERFRELLRAEKGPGDIVEKQASALRKLRAEFSQFVIPVEFKFKKTPQDLINDLKRELEVLEVGSNIVSITESITQKVKQRNQQEAEFQLRKGQILATQQKAIDSARLQVENQISAKRLQIIQAENRLATIQGRILQQQQQIAAIRSEREAGQGLPTQARQAAVQARQALNQFDQRSLSIEQQKAKITRDAATARLRLSTEADKFKATVAKRVIEAEAQAGQALAKLDQDIAKFNEKISDKKFKQEQEIASIKLKVIALELQVLEEAAKLAGNTELVNNIQAAIKEAEEAQDIISKVEPPKPISKVESLQAVSRGAGVSPGEAGGPNLAALELINAELEKVNNRVEAAQQRFTDLLDTTNAEQFASAMTGLADSFDQPLTVLNEELDAAAVKQNRVNELMNEGLTKVVAERVAEIEQMKEIAILQYDAVIAELEKKKAIEGSTEALEEQIEALKKRRDAVEGKATTAIDKEKNAPGKIENYMQSLKDDLNDTEGMIVSLAQTIENEIGSAMSTAITNVITGTGTVEEAMSTMFANIGKAFIDMATQMIAKALILKALGVMFPGTEAASSAAPAAANGTQVYGGQLINTGIMAAATGGPTRPNGTYLVGEQGPELLTMGNQSGFIHRNTSEAMDRYRAGRSSSGGGGSLNVNYNVTQINGMNFVTEEQFRAGMTKAAKDGAKMGEAGTFKSMRNSRSSRARVGL